MSPHPAESPLFPVPSPDRLSELIHQRELAQEHLAWLEHEIAAATASANAVSSVSATLSPDLDLAPGSATDAFAADPVDAQAVRRTVKRGCFLYFTLALLSLAATVVLFYFLRRPH